MPGIFVRAVGARRRLAGPARHFELGLARPQARINQPVFDVLHLRSPIWPHHIRPLREIGAAAKSSMSPRAGRAETAQKREESGLWRCLNPLFRNAILAKPPGIVPGGALGRRKGPAK